MFSRMNRFSPDARFLIYCVLVFLWVIAVWFIPHYVYMPAWFPTPDQYFLEQVSCLTPLILVFAFLLFLFFIFKGVTILNSPDRRNFSFLQPLEKFRILLGIFLFLVTPFPWLFSGQIDHFLLQEGLKHYDPLIEGIERYKQERGEYPKALEELVPSYLSAIPVPTMKIVKWVHYDPDTTQDFLTEGAGPYTLQIQGMNEWAVQRVFVYCPVIDASCKSLFRAVDTKRINSK